MRLWKNGLVQLGLVLLLLFVVGLLGLNAPAARNPSKQQPTIPMATSTATNLFIWHGKPITNYTMTVQTVAPPQPAVTVEVVVRNGKVTNEKLMECEVGQSGYSASQ